jgi:4-hydroxy-tetrahydrodipicolinate synthase
MTTEETKRLSLHAQSVGAAGLQIVPMSHWPLTEAEIFEHYREVGEAVSIPIAVHNALPSPASTSSRRCSHASPK